MMSLNLLSFKTCFHSKQVTVKNSACSFERIVSSFINTKLTKAPIIWVHLVCWWAMRFAHAQHQQGRRIVGRETNNNKIFWPTTTRGIFSSKIVGRETNNNKIFWPTTTRVKNWTWWRSNFMLKNNAKTWNRIFSSKIVGRETNNNKIFWPTTTRGSQGRGWENSCLLRTALQIFQGYKNIKTRKNHLWY